MHRKLRAASLFALLSLARPALGCLWGYDTLRDGKRGLPGMAEVLAGQWERHSRFFYQHRVTAMTAKLAKHLDDWDAMDNPAVALAKLDDLDGAIAVMRGSTPRIHACWPHPISSGPTTGSRTRRNGSPGASASACRPPLSVWSSCCAFDGGDAWRPPDAIIRPNR